MLTNLKDEDQETNKGCVASLMVKLGVKKLSGFVCAYHPVIPGLITTHNIYTFSILFELWRGEDKNKQKEDGIGPFLQKFGAKKE